MTGAKIDYAHIKYETVKGIRSFDYEHINTLFVMIYIYSVATKVNLDRNIIQIKKDLQYNCIFIIFQKVFHFFNFKWHFYILYALCAVCVITSYIYFFKYSENNESD